MKVNFQMEFYHDESITGHKANENGKKVVLRLSIVVEVHRVVKNVLVFTDLNCVRAGACECYNNDILRSPTWFRNLLYIQVSFMLLLICSDFHCENT